MCGKNLSAQVLSEGEPWTFNFPEGQNPLKTMPKAQRRQVLVNPKTEWNVYSSVIGVIPHQRIGKENPPLYLTAAVADYDMVAKPEVVLDYLSQKPKSQLPTFMERSLSGKWRLIWGFERPMLIASPEFHTAYLTTLFKKLDAPILLAGFDPNSLKATELWTNGGEWYIVGDEQGTGEPVCFLKWDFLFGVACDVSKKVGLFNKGDVALPTIAEEVEKRFPGRWEGEFKEDALGVRFWDPKADNPTGCQVKPDGMLCFTGNQPFVRWETIFGRSWCEEQKVLNLGRAANDIYFDRADYWEKRGGLWRPTSRVDVRLRLNSQGLSDRVPKGGTQSDVDRVLNYIQTVNEIDSAVPLINLQKGIAMLHGRRVLNTVDLSPVLPTAGPAGVIEQDAPWIWEFLNGFFRNPEAYPLHYFLAWLQRAYRVVIEHKAYMGQAVFVCGPKNNGKTLLCLRILAPLLGNRIANPVAHFRGETDFNSELFEAALLCVNDEDSPTTEAERKRMQARIKGFVVNPQHKFHAKFKAPVTVNWVGRIFITLNDDPGSVGMLPEVEPSTRDKMMFFASQAYRTDFPPQEELEARIAKELPHFAHYLLNVYKAPATVLANDRMGIKSYYDPHILDLSTQQTYAHGLAELITEWVELDGYWDDEKEWTGTATKLLGCLQDCPGISGIAQKWDQHKIAKALTSLAKQEGSGITRAPGAGRVFRIA